jgi:hypothetical protein
MKKSRFAEEQTIYAPRLAEGGTPAADLCRQNPPTGSIHRHVQGVRFTAQPMSFNLPRGHPRLVRHSHRLAKSASTGMVPVG